MNSRILCVILILCVSEFSFVFSQIGFASLNGGTYGGAGGPTVNVATEAELNAAVTDDDPRIVRVTALISLSALVRVGSNKSIIGGNLDAGITGSGFYIRRKQNVIIRGLKLSKSIAPDDSISIDESTNVWVDHNEFFSDLSADKDYYDGLLDVKHAADYITVSWNKFHNHYKTSLVGHSDNNAGEDIGKLRLTYHHNWFLNCESRLPSLRFGTGHIFNNVYENIGTSGINSRMGAEVLVERNIFINVVKPLVTNLDSREDGYAVERENNWGNSVPEITQGGSFTNPPYSYTMDPLTSVYERVKNGAGQ